MAATDNGREGVKAERVGHRFPRPRSVMGAHASYSRTYFFASSFVLVLPDQSLVIGPLLASIRSQKACFFSVVLCGAIADLTQIGKAPGSGRVGMYGINSGGP